MYVIKTPEEVRDTSSNARKVGCLFSVTEGIKNGKAFFVEGKERNFVLERLIMSKEGREKTQDKF